MKSQKIYVKPAIEVIHMIEEGGLCNFSKDKQNGYGYQNDTTSGQKDPNSTSFGEDYGDPFGSQAKALGAEPVGDSFYEALEKGH